MKPLTDKELEKIEELKKQKLNLKAAYDLYNLVDREFLRRQYEFNFFHPSLQTGRPH